MASDRALLLIGYIVEEGKTYLINAESIELKYLATSKVEVPTISYIAPNGSLSPESEILRLPAEPFNEIRQAFFKPANGDLIRLVVFGGNVSMYDSIIFKNITKTPVNSVDEIEKMKAKILEGKLPKNISSK